jgi:protein-disulfide isomerase
MIAIRSSLIATAAALAMLAPTQASRAQSAPADLEATIEQVIERHLASHPEAVERIVKNYIVSHPEVVQDAIADLMKRRKQAAAADASAAVKTHASALLGSPHQVNLGNPGSDLTVVEFFDYNCGYCKRALADTLALLEQEPPLKLVLKEFPVLGPGSREAAEVAVAVRMQDPSGASYLRFHREMLSGRGTANRQRALAVARDLGLDMVRLERDMASGEVRTTLEESAKLAKALGINGTPSYVIGDAVIAGAVGLAGLRQKIAAARK